MLHASDPSPLPDAQTQTYTHTRCTNPNPDPLPNAQTQTQTHTQALQTKHIEETEATKVQLAMERSASIEGLVPLHATEGCCMLQRAAARYRGLLHATEGLVVRRTSRAMHCLCAVVGRLMRIWLGHIVRIQIMWDARVRGGLCPNHSH